MVMPSGASDGNSRCTMALKDPLRSEPQIETTFKIAMTISGLSMKSIKARTATSSAGAALTAPRTACGRGWSPLLLVLDRVYEHADALDVDLAGIALLHPHRVRLAGVADAGGRAGE